MLVNEFRALETELIFDMLTHDDSDIAIEGFGDVLRNSAGNISKWWNNFITFLKNLINRLRLWFSKKRGKIMVHKEGMVILNQSINKLTSIISKPIKHSNLVMQKFVDVDVLQDTERYYNSRNHEHFSEYRKLEKKEEDDILKTFKNIEDCEIHRGEDFTDENIYEFCHIISKSVELLTSFFNAIKWDLSTVIERDIEVELDESIEIDMDDIAEPVRF